MRTSFVTDVVNNRPDERGAIAGLLGLYAPAERRPGLRLLIDRDKASDLDVNVQGGRGDRAYCAGRPVSKCTQADEQYDIWLRG
jgi:hypothetical protein